GQFEPRYARAPATPLETPAEGDPVSANAPSPPDSPRAQPLPFDRSRAVHRMACRSAARGAPQVTYNRLEPRARSWSAVLTHKLGSNLGCAGMNRRGAVKILGAKFRASGVPNAPPHRPQPSCPF